MRAFLPRHDGLPRCRGSTPPPQDISDHHPDPLRDDAVPLFRGWTWSKKRRSTPSWVSSDAKRPRTPTSGTSRHRATSGNANSQNKRHCLEIPAKVPIRAAQYPLEAPYVNLNGFANQRPNQVLGGPYGDRASLTKYLSAAAFARPATGTNGNMRLTLATANTNFVRMDNDLTFQVADAYHPGHQQGYQHFIWFQSRGQALAAAAAIGFTQY